MPPSTSTAQPTIQSPKHKAHEHTPAQNHLCNAQKPPIMPETHPSVAARPERKSFSRAGTGLALPHQPEQLQGRLLQITGLWEGLSPKQREKHGLAPEPCCTWEPHPAHGHDLLLRAALTGKAGSKMAIAVTSLLQASLPFPTTDSPTRLLAWASWAQAVARSSHAVPGRGKGAARAAGRRQIPDLWLCSSQRQSRALLRSHSPSSAFLAGLYSREGTGRGREWSAVTQSFSSHAWAEQTGLHRLRWPSKKHCSKLFFWFTSVSLPWIATESQWFNTDTQARWKHLTW